MYMQESFLHYLWKTKQLNDFNFITTNNEIVEILSFGKHNLNAGPDFLDAKVKIGEIVWVGNIEIHIKSSDWKTHKHYLNKAYDNVILHIVYKEDIPIVRANKTQIPCIELKEKIPKGIYKKYQKLLNNTNWIPCAAHFKDINLFIKNIWLERLLIERLEEKTVVIDTDLILNTNDWETVFYHYLARSFGLNVNILPFELLAKSLPLHILRKHKTNLFQLEALFFGQAGLLEQPLNDNYPNRLKQEYQFLQKKYQLIALKKEIWKFMRLRPANFPTIRIAQLAALIYQSEHLFSTILDSNNVKEIIRLFKVKISSYWEKHYLFDKESKQKIKPIGINTIYLFIINTIVPFLFLYGKKRDLEIYKNKAILLLEALPPEKNNIILNWKHIDFKATTAAQSQALLQLKKQYCNKQRCLECSIGHSILK